MATWTATNVLSGAVELPKYVEIGVVVEIYSVALTTALANGDTILGPVLPAGLYLQNLRVGATSLDSGSTIAFEAGYTGALGAFFTGSTVARGATGGIQAATLPATLGFTAATNTQILVTITAGATTPVAGTMTIEITYTASP